MLFNRLSAPVARQTGFKHFQAVRHADFRAVFLITAFISTAHYTVIHDVALFSKNIHINTLTLCNK
jgi:hypothetical protein